MQGIVTVIILPIIYFPINAYLSNKFNKNNPHIQGKNAYRNFIINNSKPIHDLFYKLDKYERDTMMKDLFLFEGIPLGFVFFIYLFLLSVKLSKVSVFNKISFFTPYYNYFYNGQKDSDLFGIFLSFNWFTVNTAVIIALFFIVFYLIGYTDPKLTEGLSLKKWSKYIYYSCWFSMGLLIGLNIGVLFFTASFADTIIKLITKLSSFRIYALISLYASAFLINFIFIGTLYRETKYFSNSFKQTVTNFYIDDFPHIRIKTNGEDISGKIDDIHNESLIILNERDTVKAIRWDQITTMEIEKAVIKDKITMERLPESRQKKSWWRLR